MPRMTTEQLAIHFDISTNSVRSWKGRKGFPDDAFSIEADSGRGYYDLDKVCDWLRGRDVSRGRKPRWLAKVGHPLARDPAERLGYAR